VAALKFRIHERRVMRLDVRESLGGQAIGGTVGGETR